MPTRTVYRPGAYETVEGERTWVPGRWEKIPDGATMLKLGVDVILSRTSYEQVVDRMAQVAADDEEYAPQLEELVEARGGIYRGALDEVRVTLGDCGLDQGARAGEGLVEIGERPRV